MEKKKIPKDLRRLRGQSFDFVQIDYASTWKRPEGSMQLKDLEVGKIVYIFGRSGRIKILSDQANWSLRTGMKPVQKDWALGVLVQAVDLDGNSYHDERSKPFVSELRYLLTKAVTPHTC